MGEGTVSQVKVRDKEHKLRSVEQKTAGRRSEPKRLLRLLRLGEATSAKDRWGGTVSATTQKSKRPWGGTVSKQNKHTYTTKPNVLQDPGG